MSHSYRLLTGLSLMLCALPAMAQTTTTRANRSYNVSWQIMGQPTDKTGVPLPNAPYENFAEVKLTLELSEPSAGNPGARKLSFQVVPGANVLDKSGTTPVVCNLYPPATTGSGPYARCDVTVSVEKSSNVAGYKTSDSWKATAGASGSYQPPTGVDVSASLNGEIAHTTETVYNTKLLLTRTWSVTVQLYNTCQTMPGYSVYVSGKSGNYKSAFKRVMSQCLYASNTSAYCGSGLDERTGNRFVSQTGTSPRLMRTYQRPDGTTFQRECIEHSSSCHAFSGVDWYFQNLTLPYVTDRINSSCALSAERYAYDKNTGAYSIFVKTEPIGGCACDSLQWTP